MDVYVAVKHVRFDRDYSAGQEIPINVINPKMIKRLTEWGKIQLVKIPDKEATTDELSFEEPVSEVSVFENPVSDEPVLEEPVLEESLLEESMPDEPLLDESMSKIAKPKKSKLLL